MNVQVLKPTNVTSTPCVQTLKGPTSVAVKGVILVMVKTAQVKYRSVVDLYFHHLSFQKASDTGGSTPLT